MTEVGAVAGDQDETVMNGDGGDQRVHGRHGNVAGDLRRDLAPGAGDAGIEPDRILRLVQPISKEYL